MKISVLIPFRSTNDEYRDRNFGQVWTEWMQFLGESGEIVIGKNDAEIFNRSAARNDAVKRSRGDVLILADADTTFVPSQIATAIGMIANEDADWVLPYTLYYNATEEWSARYCEVGGRMDKPPPVWDHCLPGSTAGVLVTSKRVYEEVGGYDERFIGWGWEDLAFSCALSSLCHNPQRVDGAVVHLYHHRSVEENFGQPHEQHNRALYDRYCAVEHDTEAMKALIKEHYSCELT